MKIFSAQQIKEWDNYTIAHEPITSVDLMERAAGKCFRWIIKKFPGKDFKIFCGKGNNGGDGLAIARMLIENDCNISIYILETNNNSSQDFEINFSRLKALTKNIFFIHSENDIPQVGKSEIIIDAIFGTGLNKSPEGVAKLLIQHINQSSEKIISIDIASGLFADKSSKENTVVEADYTLTFQQRKLAFMMPENEKYFGKIKALDIDLHKDFIKKESALFEYIDDDIIKTIFKKRDQFAHKGTFGHACLITGSYGMIGAATLAALACLRSGVGKLSICIPKAGYEIIQACVPEGIVKICGENFIENVESSTIFDAIGIGPGIGNYASNKNLLQKLFAEYKKPVVLDADALNTISLNKDLLEITPEQSIITPHPKEFERLFGKTKNDFETIDLALEKSSSHKIYIVLKGHHTFIATPDKKGYFNSSGNAGMATAGSGDLLTGIITGLSAQGYDALKACILGVYLHGMAGDIAAKKISQEAMIAGDIIEHLGKAFKKINRLQPA